MIFNKVDTKLQMTTSDIVKYQIMTYCYLKEIIISRNDLKTLVELSLMGIQELDYFCNYIYEQKQLFNSAQTVRNSLSKCDELGLIIKEGKSKKTIVINPSLQVQTTGNILLDFKILAIESEEV